MAVAKLSITFFLQMAVILATCRVVGWLGQKYLRQPQVVCEMIAGVLLGPSLFGLRGTRHPDTVFTPENQGRALRRRAVRRRPLHVPGRPGVPHRPIQGNVHKAASVSIAGMAVPFVMAVAADAVAHDGARLVLADRVALRRHAVHGRGHRDHRVPDARADHPRARLEPHVARHAVAVSRRDRRRGRLVRAGSSAGELRRAGAGVAYLAIVGGMAFAVFMIFVDAANARAARARPSAKPQRASLNNTLLRASC